MAINCSARASVGAAALLPPTSDSRRQDYRRSPRKREFTSKRLIVNETGNRSAFAAKVTGARTPDAFIVGAMFEITGTVKKIFEEQTFGSGFNKREFVLTIESGKFPQDIKFECVKDKVALVAALKPGTKAKVFFDLRGREWKESYFVNLNAWKIETLGSNAAAPADDDDRPPLSEPDGETVNDDVPF